jgi:dolichyl-phosphate-mannose--protein O-mannosyl transferase
VAASFASVRSGLSLKSQLWWCVLTGLCLGCCLSVKLTALGILATVGVHQLLGLLVSSSSLTQVLSRGVPRAALILSMAAAVFYGLWAVHVTMLPYTGQGDGFMNSEYQASLVEKTFPDRPSCPNHANVAFPCGLPNITRSQCEENDCCWDTTSRKV